MGRKPTKPGAIPRFRVRRQKSGKVFYYYDHGGSPRRETPLGSDYGLAIKRWAELEHENLPPAHAIVTFKHVADAYLREVVPTKSVRTQTDNAKERTKLLDYFDDPPVALDAIKPLHVRQYMTWRTKKGKGYVRANREKALLSHIWNFARERGYTDLPNPCAGVKGFKEDGRDVYLEDAEYQAILKHADVCLKDAMELAYLTGQRPADVLGMTEMDVRDGAVHFRQGKTKTKVRIEVSQELADVLKRIRKRKNGYTKVFNTRLVVNEYGRPIGVNAMSRRWVKAREKAGIEGVQFRDLRAKAGTDKADSAGDIRQAQKQLGHKSVVMTETYVRNRRGHKTTPTK